MLQMPRNAESFSSLSRMFLRDVHLGNKGLSWVKMSYQLLRTAHSHVNGKKVKDLDADDKVQHAIINAMLMLSHKQENPLQKHKQTKTNDSQSTTCK